MASKILHLPDYCNLFKDFLVEELIFHESPFEFHFGKCLVIGKLCRRNNLCYLQNISLGCLDEEYRLKTGAVEILLLPTSYRSNPGDMSSFQRNLVNGSFYEIHGETAFIPQCESVDLASSSINTLEMVIKLRINNLQFHESHGGYDLRDIPAHSCDFNEIDVQRDVDEFQKNHVPAIQVHTMNEIDDAEALISTNLQLRLMRNQRRQANY